MAAAQYLFDYNHCIFIDDQKVTWLPKNLIRPRENKNFIDIKNHEYSIKIAFQSP